MKKQFILSILSFSILGSSHLCAATGYQDTLIFNENLSVNLPCQDPSRTLSNMGSGSLSTVSFGANTTDTWVGTSGALDLTVKTFSIFDLLPQLGFLDSSGTAAEFPNANDGGAVGIVLPPNSNNLIGSVSAPFASPYLTSTSSADEPTVVKKIAKGNGSNGINNAWFTMTLKAGRHHAMVTPNAILGQMDGVDAPNGATSVDGNQIASVHGDSNDPANYTIICPSHKHLALVKILGLKSQAYDVHLGFTGKVNLGFVLNSPYLIIDAEGCKKNSIGFLMTSNGAGGSALNNVLLYDNENFQTTLPVDYAFKGKAQTVVLNLENGQPVNPEQFGITPASIIAQGCNNSKYQIKGSNCKGLWLREDSDYRSESAQRSKHKSKHHTDQSSSDEKTESSKSCSKQKSKHHRDTDKSCSDEKTESSKSHHKHKSKRHHKRKDCTDSNSKTTESCTVTQGSESRTDSKKETCESSNPSSQIRSSSPCKTDSSNSAC